MIEAYGMTEASHQMTSNPLPPGVRKPGSVGDAAGVEIAIMDAPGRLGADASGEIVIRGPGVTRGYENNPEANARAFTDGWFRTGDQGRLDGDGYLFISGRLKEIVNRGGREGLAARGRRGAARASRRGAGGRLRRAASDARRGCGRGSRAARGRGPTSSRCARSCSRGWRSSRFRRAGVRR